MNFVKKIRPLYEKSHSWKLSWRTRTNRCVKRLKSKLSFTTCCYQKDPKSLTGLYLFSFREADVKAEHFERKGRQLENQLADQEKKYEDLKAKRDELQHQLDEFNTQLDQI